MLPPPEQILTGGLLLLLALGCEQLRLHRCLMLLPLCMFQFCCFHCLYLVLTAAPASQCGLWVQVPIIHLRIHFVFALQPPVPLQQQARVDLW